MGVPDPADIPPTPGDTVQAPDVAALPPEVVAVIAAARAWARWIDEGHGSAINHVTGPIYDAVAKLDYEQSADTIQARAESVRHLDPHDQVRALLGTDTEETDR